MDRLLFQSLAAAKSQGTIRAQLTNDLANTSTPGFKKSFDHGLLRSVKVTADYGYQSRYQPVVQHSNVIDLKPGPQMQTCRLLDISMQNQTVLGVLTENEQVAFTRRGDLQIRGDGVLVTGNGLEVAGEGGVPIVTIPQTVISIAKDGTVNATFPDEPEGEPVPIGQLMLRDASEQVLVRRKDGF